MSGIGAVGSVGSVGAAPAASAGGSSAASGCLPAPIASFANTALALAFLKAMDEDEDQKKKGSNLLGLAMMAVALSGQCHVIRSADCSAYQDAGASILGSSEARAPQMTSDRFVRGPEMAADVQIQSPGSHAVAAYAAAAGMGGGLSAGGGSAGTGGATLPMAAGGVAA